MPTTSVAKKLQIETEALNDQLAFLVTERQTERLLAETEAIVVKLRRILKDEQAKESTKELALVALGTALMLLASKPQDLGIMPVTPSMIQVAPQKQKSNKPTVFNQTRNSGFNSRQLLQAARKLFENPKSIGSIAVGHAEGNYDIDGNPQGNYFRHIDPGNLVKNMGFCSDQGRGGGDIDRANAECIKYIVGSFPRLIETFQEAEINPSIFEFLAAADLYNQAAPRHSKLFAKKLVEVREKLKDKNLSEVELVANVRAATFWIDGKNTAKGLERACNARPNPPDSAWDCVYGDQLRRVRAIARVLKHRNISLSAPLVEQPQVQEASQPKFQFPHLNLFGNSVNRAPEIVPSEQDILATKLIKYMEAQGYEIARHPKEINIIFLRNSPKATNRWTDKLYIIKFINDVPKIVGKWNATTVPGEHYIKFGKKIGAPFAIAGQHKVWQVGTHIGIIEQSRGGTGHEALIQTGGEIEVLRDKDKDGAGEVKHRGFFGINIHGTRNQSTVVNQSSAGCLVVGGEGWGMRAIQEVMKFVKNDRRYKTDKNFIFPATIIENWRL